MYKYQCKKCGNRIDAKNKEKICKKCRIVIKFCKECGKQITNNKTGYCHKCHFKHIDKIPWNKGKTKDNDNRIAKLASYGFKNKKHSLETKEKIRIGKTDKIVSKETKKKKSIKKQECISNGWEPWIKGKHHTEKTKEKIRQKTLQQYKDGSIKSISKGEKRIFSFLKENNFNVQQQKCIERKMFDLFIPELNMLIEYDGDYWHSKPDRIENDKLKNNIAIRNNFRLIRIKEKNENFVWDIIN